MLDWYSCQICDPFWNKDIIIIIINAASILMAISRCFAINVDNIIFFSTMDNLGNHATLKRRHFYKH